MQSFAQLPYVQPAGGFKHYILRREQRFDYSPASKSNFLAYQSYIKSVTPGGFADYLPWKYQIEPNSSCNLRCSFCAVSTWETQRRAPDMPFQTFTDIIDENPALLEVNLTPLGEPFLAGDVFIQMVKYSVDSLIWTRATTNATLLHIGNYSRSICDSGIDELVISIDSFDQPTYEKLRKGSNLSLVLRNVETLHHHLSLNSRQHITKCNIVLTPSNAHQVREIAQQALNYGFTNISFTVDAFSWGISSLKPNNVSQSLSVSDLLSLHNDFIQKGLYVGFVTTTSKFDYTSPEISTRCSWPFSSLYIGSDLTYPPCCHIGDPNVFSLGAGCTPLEIWNSNSYRLFRQSHIEGRLPNICRECYN